MTIDTTTSRVDALGNGSATVFSFSPVIIFEASDLQVFVTDNLGNVTTLTLGAGPTDFSVNVSAYPGTGSVTYPASGGGTTLATGWTLTMKRVVPLLQKVSLENQGPYLPNVLEMELDYLTAIAQQLQEQTNRSLQLAPTDPDVPLTFPPAAVRANNVLAFDSLGNPTVLPGIVAGTVPVSNPVAPLLNAASINALFALLTYLPPGANAVTRFLSSGMNDVVSVINFGAQGNGIHDDTVAFQEAIIYCKATGKALYVPSAPDFYLITVALNLANTNGFKLYGDGAAPTVNRWTPQGFSTIGGNTGSGKPIIDATGANGLVIRDLTLGSIGLTNPSTLGVIMGTSTLGMGGGGSCNRIENVSIFMASSGAACGVYGVNANLLVMDQVNIMSDFCLVLVDTNILAISPPFATFGASIQSDGHTNTGCNLEGYGTQTPLVLKNASCHQYTQLYIVNINDSAGYTGVANAMSITGCSDIDMKVEIDYFPSAVVMAGFNTDITLRGIIYRDVTPILSGQAAVATFVGTGLNRCKFFIRNEVSSTGNVLYQTNSGAGRTNVNFYNCEFLFDTALNTTTCAFDVTAAAAVPYYNLTFVGNTDYGSAGIVLEVTGSAAATSAYRIFVQGIKVGTA